MVIIKIRTVNSYVCLFTCNASRTSIDEKTIPDVKISNRIGEVAQHHTAGRKGATDESYCSIRVLGRQNTR